VPPGCGDENSMSAPPINESAGRIVTFYSYKGGVGRSMALANIAVILARDFGLDVVAIDWDLEAPGLNRYFDIPDAEVGPGIIDYFTRYKQLLAQPPEDVEISTADLDIRTYVKQIESYPDGGSISFLSAGEQRDVPLYVDRVSGFDWDDFYRNWNGAQLLEAIRVQLSQLGDVVLIDSRTGITDTGGICTLHLPDVVVLVFVFNDQNLDGIARIAAEISGKNAVFELTQRHPEALFLPSRKDVSEIGQLREWEGKAVALFQPFFESPRITDRFGDNGLDYIRATSVPYVPYFAFGEELAASTDKGYEMTAALEVLAEMLSERAPLPRKRRPSQPFVAAGKGQGPRREPSFSGRRIAVDGQELRASAAGSELPLDTPPGTAGDGGQDEPADHDGRAGHDGQAEHSEHAVWSFGRRARRRAWVGAIAVTLVGITALGVGTIIDWNISSLTQHEDPFKASSTESGSDDTGETLSVEPLDLGLLRAVVRFEFLAIYPRDQPAPRVFDGSLRAEFAIGSTSGAGGWTRKWQLQDIEQQLRASVIDDLQLVANVQSVAYRGFEPSGATTQELTLEHLAGQQIEARLVGPGASPGWLTEAWAKAEAQGVDPPRLTKSFRKFYGVADKDELLVDITPVIATMQMEYDGRPFASLTGWVARDPTTRDLVINFAPAQASDPALASASSPEPLPSSVAAYVERRDEQQKWLAGIQGVGTYSEGRGKLIYRLGIAVPTTEARGIESVTYVFGDGSAITTNKAGPTNDWSVTTTRKSCEGTVSIELGLANGVALPLSFDWCQDAVKISVQGKPDDPSQSSSCNLNLVAKNPHLAQRVCATEYELATSEAEKARLLESLIAAHASYGASGDYCWWLDQLSDDAVKAELAADKARCAIRPNSLSPDRLRLEKKPKPPR
jgi:hypothetical protein